MSPQAAIATDTQPMARRAALAVHALGPDDRAWLLAQLPATQRERIAPLLEELRALGIPADGGLLDDILRHPAPEPAIEPKADVPVAHKALQQDSFAQQQDALGHLDAAVMSKLLQSEPAGLIVQLLEIQDWPWRQVVLEQLGPVKQRRVEELRDSLRRLARPKAPEAMQRALVAAIHRRAIGDAVPSKRQEPVRPSATSVTVGHVMKWRTALVGWLKPRSMRST